MVKTEPCQLLLTGLIPIPRRYENLWPKKDHASYCSLDFTYSEAVWNLWSKFEPCQLLLVGLWPTPRRCKTYGQKWTMPKKNLLDFAKNYSYHADTTNGNPNQKKMTISCCHTKDHWFLPIKSLTMIAKTSHSTKSQRRVSPIRGCKWSCQNLLLPAKRDTPTSKKGKRPAPITANALAAIG